MTAALHAAAPALLTIPETASELRCSRATVYRLVNSGQLPMVRVGSLTRIERSALTDYITGLRKSA